MGQSGTTLYDVRISYMQVYQDSAYDLIGAPLSAENKGETLPRIVLLDDVRGCGRAAPCCEAAVYSASERMA